MDNIFKIHENCFFGKGIRKPERYVKKMKTGKFIKDFYVVAFCNGNTRLEAFSGRMFLQEYFRKQSYVFAAIVKSEEDAFEYIRALSEISVRKYGEFDALKTIDGLTADELESLKTSGEDAS